MLGFDEFQELLAHRRRARHARPDDDHGSARVRTARHLRPARARAQRARRQQPGRSSPAASRPTASSSCPTDATSCSCTARQGDRRPDDVSLRPGRRAAAAGHRPHRRSRRRARVGSGDPPHDAIAPTAIDAILAPRRRWDTARKRTATGCSARVAARSLICAGMPFAFLLGIHGLVWILPAVVFGPQLLVRREPIVIPRSAIPLLLLVAWIPIPMLQLDAGAARHSRCSGSSCSRRRSLCFLWLVNRREARRSERARSCDCCRSLWIVLIAFGFLAILLPHFSTPRARSSRSLPGGAAVELVLPRHHEPPVRGGAVARLRRGRPAGGADGVLERLGFDARFADAVLRARLLHPRQSAPAAVRARRSPRSR